MTGSILIVEKILVFAITFLFVANIPEYVLTLRIGLFPYQFYFVATAILLCLALFSKRLFRVPKENFSMVVWFVGLAVCCLASILFISADSVAIDELIRITTFSGIGASLALVLANRSLLHACGYGILSAVIVCTVLTYMEFFDPNFNVMVDAFFEGKVRDGVVQRSGGLFGNPNANGYAITLGMFIGQYFIPKSLRLIFALFVGFAVFTTVSRSAILLWVLVVLYECMAGNYIGRSFATRVIGILSVIGLYFALASGQLLVAIQSAGLDEFMNDNMIERLSGDFFSQGDSSSTSRIDAAETAAELFTQNPIFGAGLGAARGGDDVFGDVGAHNMLAKMGAELGIIGVIVYLLLLLVPFLANSRGGLVFVVLFLFVNMFTHNSFDRPVFAILIPMAILYFSVFHTKKNRRRRRRKRTSAEQDHFQQVRA